KVLDARISKDLSEAARDDYKRKLHLLQNALYGVDLQEFAANMARLRFWLSLAVDMVEPDPLPNLEYKIGVGDSLLAPDPSGVSDLFRQTIQRLAEELGRLKARYADPFDPGNTDPLKKALHKSRIDALREQIRRQMDHDQSCPEGAFDWLVEFAEVFLPPDGRPGGFDVVLANPPYVMQEEIDDLRPDFPGGYKAFLLRAFHASMTGKSDLFCAFYQRANQLLREGGVQIMICSTGWLDSGYGDRLQEYLLQSTRILRILESSTDRQFLSAAINTLISFLRKEASSEARLRQQVEFVRVTGEIDQGLCRGSRTILRTQRQLLAEGRLLGGGYRGGKWGGRYLRSPDALLDVLAEAADRLKPLGSCAALTSGLKTGANDFFYVRITATVNGVAHFMCLDGAERRIEARYLRPVIVNSASIRRPILRPEDADHHVILLPRDEDLEPLAERYVEWGQSKGFDKRTSVSGRKRWYSLTPPKPELLLTPMVRDRRPLIGWNVAGLYVDHNFFGVSTLDPEDLEVLGASLLSTLGYLIAEAYGRANLGGGAIKTEGIDILQFPVLDPKQVRGEARTALLDAFRAACKSQILTIEREVAKPERRALDQAVLAAALPGTREVPEFLARLQAAAVETATRRLAKARGKSGLPRARQAPTLSTTQRCSKPVER
ncbi:MAG: Eco57I restriction-modification methylase domain-containing protein, partial [Fimbriimonadaceae bacterium]